MSWIKKTYYKLISSKSSLVLKTDFDDHKASIVISSFKRIPNVIRIVEEYLNYELLSEIIIWHNGPEKLNVPFSDKKIRTIESDDFGLASRYAAALLSSSDTVLLQDDDIVLPESSLNTIVRAKLEYPQKTICIEGKVPHADGTYGKTVKPKPGQKMDCDIHLNRLVCTNKEAVPAFFTFLHRTKLSLDPKAGGGEDIVYSYAITEKTGEKPLAVGVEFTNLESSNAISKRYGNQHANRTKIMNVCLETCINK